MKCYILVIVLLLVNLSGCTDRYQEVRRDIDVGPFENISLKSVFAIYLKQDNFYSVAVQADDDIIDQIKIEVENGVLTLSDESKMKWTSPESNRIKVTITAPSFYNIIAEQSYSLHSVDPITINELRIINFAEVKISDIDLHLEGTYFYYWNNWLAGGKLVVKGKVETFQAHNYALHLIDAKELETNNTIIYNYGRENCKVNVVSRLEYALDGPGNIILYGNPSEIVLLEKTSSGRLIRAQ